MELFSSNGQIPHTCIKTTNLHFTRIIISAALPYVILTQLFLCPFVSLNPSKLQLSSSMTSETSDASKVADYLIGLLEERGTGDYIGESISQLEHCLQCANSAANYGNCTISTYCLITYM